MQVPQHSVFYRPVPFLSPNQQRQSPEGNFWNSCSITILSFMSRKMCQISAMWREGVRCIRNVWLSHEMRELGRTGNILQWISCVLKSLYLGDVSASQEQNRFTSLMRAQQSRVFCLISTPSVGYLYCIGGDSFHLVSTYHYAAAVTQVSSLCTVMFYIYCSSALTMLLSWVAGKLFVSIDKQHIHLTTFFGGNLVSRTREVKLFWI